MRVPLNESVLVTLDGSGNGTVKAGPISGRETWYPANAHVCTTASDITNEAVCQVYAGDQAIKANFRDNTFTGSSGDSTGKVSADVLRCGQYVWAVWTGGDPGAVMRLNVTGERDI